MALTASGAHTTHATAEYRNLYKALGGGWRECSEKNKVSPNSARVASAARALR